MPSIISAGTTTGTALSLTSDTSGELQIRTNNGSTTAMTLTTAGLVGIGTTSPNAASRTNIVSSGTSTSAFGNVALRLSSNGSGYASTLVFSDEVANSAGISMVSGNLAFGAGGFTSERMRIDGNGNVVIGTTSAYSKFCITTTNGNFGITGGNTSGGNKIQSFGATTSSNGYLAFEGYDREYMRIDSSGNVGIGTSSPNTTAANRVVLDVNGTTSALLNISSGGTRRATFYSDSTDCVFGSITSIPLEFLTGGTERMRINSGGDLLIGTTSNNGSTSNSAKTVSGAFTTNNGSAINTTINVATDLVTLPSSFGMCLFRVFLGGVGSPADSESLAIICVNASSASQTNLKAGGWAVISLSGLTVRATQNQFTGANIGWSLIRLS